MVVEMFCLQERRAEEETAMRNAKPRSCNVMVQTLVLLVLLACVYRKSRTGFSPLLGCCATCFTSLVPCRRRS